MRIPDGNAKAMRNEGEKEEKEEDRNKKVVGRQNTEEDLG